jgi:hypothetical protein
VIQVTTKWARAAIVCCCALCGCATIISGTTQDIGVSSVPPGATVIAELGGHRAVRPAKLTPRCKEAPYRLTFPLEGYRPYNVTISAGTNGWIFGNLVLGGIIGILVDSVDRSKKMEGSKKIELHHHARILIEVFRRAERARHRRLEPPWLAAAPRSCPRARSSAEPS